VIHAWGAVAFVMHTYFICIITGNGGNRREMDETVCNEQPGNVGWLGFCDVKSLVAITQKPPSTDAFVNNDVSFNKRQRLYSSAGSDST